MIVKINLSVLKFDLDEPTIDKLDEKFDKEMQKLKREALKKYLQEQDDKFAKKGINCPHCNNKMSIKDKQTLKIKMTAGKVVIKRRRYNCDTCSYTSYPLDEHFSIKDKHTLAVAEQALYLATEMSYEKASTALEKLKGTRISHGKIQTLAKQEGALINKDLEKKATDLFELGLDPGENKKEVKTIL
jgi:DNA-directed RNA polymerase subunit RPC12/RpoP